MSADEGAPLHPVARDLLAQFRAQEDMPADARARVRRRLEADDVAPAREGRRDGRSWIVWSLVGAAAGVALLLGLKAIAPSLGSEDDAPKLEAAPDRVERSEQTSRASVRETKARAQATAPVEGVQAEKVVPPEPEPEPEPSASTDAAVDPPTRRVRRASPIEPAIPEAQPTPAVPEPVTPSSTLDAERRLLAQAWNALTAGDPSAAIASATAHRDRFPNGILAPERMAIEAIARCKRDGDQTRAVAFLKTHARSPLATRVREACGLAAPSAGSSEERTPTGR